MEKKFAEYKQFDLSEINREILDKWEKENSFEESLKAREGAPAFIFYEGPPSANGKPGIHHMLSRTIKDSICRYRTQKGFCVNRKAGWDTHGLPVELGVEQKLGITKEDIGKKITVEDYNSNCRSEVMKYTDIWRDLTLKMGYWVNIDDPYITYDNRYIETLWYLLKQLFNKGLLYKGYTIQPYSPAAGTGLSTHELNQPGCYRKVKDTTCVAQFKMLDPKPDMAQWGTPYFIAWTTTPWTLPSNTALCVGPKISYSVVQSYNAYTGQKISVVLATDLIYNHFNKKAENLSLDEYKHGDKLIPFKIVGQYTGAELVGMKYQQLIPWVKPVTCKDKGIFEDASKDAFRVIPGDYVTTEDGTGIVHIAPTFGADDAKVAKAAGIPSLFIINKKDETRPMVDFTGKFYLTQDIREDFLKSCVSQEYNNWEGKWVKNAYDPAFTVDGKYDEAAAQNSESLDVALCISLKQSDKVFKIEKHEHDYPHCWRTDKPVLYYPLDSWFIKVTDVKNKMVELNHSINWNPVSTGEGRFGKWLENIQDWNLSRSRYWGTPLPVWRNDNGDQQICIGSLEELCEQIDKSVKAGFMDVNPYTSKGFVVGDYSKENYDKIDIHRPYVDDIILVGQNGERLFREKDLIDVWFDSGAMPFAQRHWPFEHKDDFDTLYPADFVAEGVDQTRGWFYTLHAISTMINGKVAFKNIISNGLVLDKNGNKMSKRLGNAVDPFETIAKYGSDTVRWYMITNAQPWDNLKFDPSGVDEIKRKFFGTLYNTYQFFALYANVDGFTYKEADVEIEKRPEIDRWILSLLNTLIKKVDNFYDAYDLTSAGRQIQDFVCNDLSNWYVRLNRKRYWGGEYSSDKISAYQTLYTCLETVSRLMAPIAPFYADKLFLDLNAVSGKSTEKSVHIAYFPVFNPQFVDSVKEQRMAIAQQITSMVLALRRKASLKVRQPLSKISIPILNKNMQEDIEAVKHLILNEINVKELEYLHQTAGIISKKVKADFKQLGSKLGKDMKIVAGKLAALTQEQIQQFEADGSMDFDVNGVKVNILTSETEITSEDIPGRLVASEGKITVALDVTVTDQLRNEGFARELINRIQNIRKESDFEVIDKIKVEIAMIEPLVGALKDFGDYICSQTLTQELLIKDINDAPDAKIIEIDEQISTSIRITKI